MRFAAAPRAKLHSTNPIERLNGEARRRPGVVGRLPNEATFVRVVGAIPREPVDAWATQRAFHMAREAISSLRLCHLQAHGPASPTISPDPPASWLRHHPMGHDPDGREAIPR
jgi:hypothetical protein